MCSRPATLNTFLGRGVVASRLTQDVSTAQSQLTRLAALGIDLDAITDKLQADGVAAFAKSFETLPASVAAKCEKLSAQSGRVTVRPVTAPIPQR